MNTIDTTHARLQTMRFDDDGATPNSRFPVLLYHLHIAPSVDAASALSRSLSQAPDLSL